MLEIIGLRKKYGKKEVLKNISFQAQKGRILSFLGQNGSGKTTTFKIILDLLQPDEGKVLFDGSPIEKKRIGYLPEERVMYPDCSIDSQVYLFGRLKGLRDSQIEKQFEYYLSLMQLQDYRYERITKLSKGNAQKVQLILCLINDPEIIILDEPWTGLDQENVKLFERIILKLKEEGKCIILSSHQYQPIQSVCDDYIYLENGEIKIKISKEELMKDDRRVLQLEVIDYFFLEDETIITEKMKGNNVTYILKNDSNIEKLLKECRNSSLVKSYSVNYLTISELIGDKQ